jgi:uncharacterized protein (TIGR02246 family)
MSDLLEYQTLSVEDRVGLTALNMEYAWRVDFGHAESVPELFTDDCVWAAPPGAAVGGTVNGRAQMIDHWKRRAQVQVTTRHVISNLRFVLDSPATARGWVSLTCYVAHQGEPKPATAKIVADYLDTYAKGADGRWRIRTRHIETVFGAL